MGDKPLLMRAEFDLDSPVVMVLRQGQMVTVLEERPMTESKGASPALGPSPPLVRCLRVPRVCART